MSADGQILVNFGTIETAGQQVRDGANQIQQQLDDLKAGVTRIASSWTGAAKEGYDARQATWDQKATELHETLNKIASALDNAHQSYTQTESANANIWNG